MECRLNDLDQIADEVDAYSGITGAFKDYLLNGPTDLNQTYIANELLSIHNHFGEYVARLYEEVFDIVQHKYQLNKLPELPGLGGYNGKN